MNSLSVGLFLGKTVDFSCGYVYFIDCSISFPLTTIKNLLSHSDKTPFIFEVSPVRQTDIV